MTGKNQPGCIVIIMQQGIGSETIECRQKHWLIQNQLQVPVLYVADATKLQTWFDG